MTRELSAEIETSGVGMVGETGMAEGFFDRSIVSLLIFRDNDISLWRRERESSFEHSEECSTLNQSGLRGPRNSRVRRARRSRWMLLFDRSDAIHTRSERSGSET